MGPGVGDQEEGEGSLTPHRHNFSLINRRQPETPSPSLRWLFNTDLGLCLRGHLP